MWQYRKEIHQREPTPTIVQKQKDNIFQQECPFQIFFCKWISDLVVRYEIWVKCKEMFSCFLGVYSKMRMSLIENVGYWVNSEVRTEVKIGMKIEVKCFKRKGRKSCVFGKINHFNLIFGIRTWWFKLEYFNLVFGIWNFNLLFGIWTFYRFFYFFLFWVLNVRFKSWTDSKSCRTFHAHGKVIYEIITGMSI